MVIEWEETRPGWRGLARTCGDRDDPRRSIVCVTIWRAARFVSGMHEAPRRVEAVPLPTGLMLTRRPVSTNWTLAHWVFSDLVSPRAVKITRSGECIDATGTGASMHARRINRARTVHLESTAASANAAERCEALRRVGRAPSQRRHPVPLKNFFPFSRAPASGPRSFPRTSRSTAREPRRAG